MNNLEKELALHGEVIIAPKGHSMRPFLTAGRDRVLIKPAEQIRKYDVVLYQNEDGIYVLHRVIGRQGEETYLICGDNSLTIESVDRQRIFGVLSRILRRGKWQEANSPLRKIYARIWCCPPVRHFVMRIKRIIRGRVGHEDKK